MRVTTKPLQGECEVYDGTNLEAFAALAGARCRAGADGPEVEVTAGLWAALEPGWSVLVPGDGTGRVILSAPGPGTREQLEAGAGAA